MYKSYCTDKGRMDGRELKPGTAVFTGTEDNHGHVGLYIGNGVVIEAAGTKQGVITSKLSNTKWTYWGELKGVDYSGEPTPATKPVLRKGDKGPYVKEMQQDLLDHGYDLGKWGADGSFGNATEAALKAFQKDHGLVADGICGQRTWDALEETETILYTVTIQHCTKHQAETLQSQYPGAIITEE